MTNNFHAILPALPRKVTSSSKRLDPEPLLNAKMDVANGDMLRIMVVDLEGVSFLVSCMLGWEWKSGQADYGFGAQPRTHIRTV